MRVRKLNLFNNEAEPKSGKKTLVRKKPPVSPAVETFDPSSSTDSIRTEDKELPQIPNNPSQNTKQPEGEEEEDLNEVPSSPTFNIASPAARESYMDDDDFVPKNDGYKSLGANARASTHDVFVTALDFTSPQKSNKSIKITSPHRSPEKQLDSIVTWQNQAFLLQMSKLISRKMKWMSKVLFKKNPICPNHLLKILLRPVPTVRL